MACNRWRGAVLVLFLGWATWLPAQQSDTRLTGRVLAEGRPIPGVAVLLAELRKIEVTDSAGRYTFPGLDAGTYTLVLTMGENSATREKIGILAGQTRELDIDVDWKLGVTESVTVTAAAERAAKIVDAPAAVTSIAEETIERQASHGQLPKVLEFTPGAEVTQSGLYDFNFNTRGFNSSLNRRVSTYIDGRDVGVVLLGAQEWAAISGGLGDVANLEFIRGPSAALYGANASSGVVNITTKSPRESLGTTIRLSGGELDTFSIDFRQAAEIRDGWYYKVLAGSRTSGDFSVSRNPDVVPGPEYAEFCELIGESDCLPKEKTLFREQDDDIKFASVRVDKHFDGERLLTFETGASDIEGPVFQTGIGRVQIRDAERPFYRVAYSAPRWNISAHLAERDGDQANLTKDLVANFELLSDTQRYGVEAQANWDLACGRGRLVVGAAHTEEKVDTENPATGRQTVVYKPISTNRQAVFSQFDWKLNDKIKFVAAGRVDKNTLHDTQFSPKLAMVYSMHPKHSMRFTFNKAFQVANYSEFFLHTPISNFPMAIAQDICSLPPPLLAAPVDCGDIPRFIPILAVGNNDLELEKTEAWEVGYSGIIANRAFITVDYYNSKNTNFISDLVPQVGTTLGICPPDDPVGDPTNCPINTDYTAWTSTPEAESTFINGLFDPDGNPITVADAIRNYAERTVGGATLGFRLANDLDGSTVVVGRTYTNVGNVDTQGVDFGLQYFINNLWTVQASYSWFDFTIVDDVVIAAEDVQEILLPNSPEHKASLSISYAKNRFSANLSGRWVDDFRWSAGVFQGDVKAYSTVDFSANLQYNDVVTFGVNVANLRGNVHRQTFGGDLLDRRALANMTFNW